MGNIKKNPAPDSVKVNDSRRFFVDRENQRDIFKQHLGQISLAGSSLIFYSGAGGIGKTALIKELENYTSTKKQIFKYASYDFPQVTDMLSTLNALKENLISEYSAQFPLFEKGCILYYQKRGDMVSTQQIKEILNKNSVLHKKVSSLLGTLDNVTTVAKVGNTFLEDGTNFLSEATEVVADATVFGKFVKLGLGELDKFINRRDQKAKEANDETYRKIVQELNQRNAAPSAEALKEFLPTLFARDISDWLAENPAFKLVIFLDTYENLTGDEKDIKQHEKLSSNVEVPVDWWIETLLFETSGVLWIIAGRSEIKKIGSEIEITDDMLFPLTALDNNFSNEFLQKSGVENPALREGIIKLTGGYPNYLSICADTYREILSSGRVPTVEDFGTKRESIINRLLSFMNETARNMVKRLCILGTWTDIFAKRVL
ncbi:MAG: ATP-binding protein, partial [Selenomonadaceae bacterium]|nr:ATP-binding protein [Selenomonadaceae bacterium]